MQSKASSSPIMIHQAGIEAADDYTKENNQLLILLDTRGLLEHLIKGGGGYIQRLFLILIRKSKEIVALLLFI